jgi:Protein of unknown function (DUF664)
VISTDDLLWYVDEALDGMISIVHGLGDDRSNRVPDLDGANCAYAVLTHCLGVLEYWGGYVIAGRPVQRERDGEFRARGEVAGLVRRAREARAQLASDLANLEPFAPPRGIPEPEDAVLPLGRTQGGAAVHILEELAQHRGQLEITRDLLTSSA